MNSNEAVQAELAARYAERAAAKLLEKGVSDAHVALRILAAGLRSGAHLRGVETDAEIVGRVNAIVEDLKRQMGSK